MSGSSRAEESPAAFPVQTCEPADLDWQLVAESIPHMVWMAGADGSIQYVNRRAREYMAWPPEADNELAWAALVHADDVVRARSAWRYANRTETSYELDYRIRRADGQFHWHSCRCSPVRDPSGNVVRWIGTATDIEDHERLVEELLQVDARAPEAQPEALRQVDARAPQPQTDAPLPEPQPLGSDASLCLPAQPPAAPPQATPPQAAPPPAAPRQVAPPPAAPPWGALDITASAADAGALVSPTVFETVHGDEFLSIVMDSLAEGLYTLDDAGMLTFMNRAASKMLGWKESELRGRFAHAAIHFQNADGSPLPADECPSLRARTEGRLVRDADETFTRKDGSIFPVVYSAAPFRIGSTVNGVVVVFRDATDERVQETHRQTELAVLSWIGRIRDALDEGRFVLYSQPIRPLGAGDQGEELLLRMLGRSGEVILPASFLPVAEKYGLIGEIDRWVIAEAIRLAATGRRVDANLSARSIGTVDLLALIEHEIRSTGADPANIVFEITETAIMRDIEAGEAFARGLANIGCGLALDDFGTGFGSFTYLKKLPLTFLKIDCEFVVDLARNSANRHVVRAIVGLASAFGLQTIAEGVEDEETLVLLRDAGVDFGQGNYLGPPARISAAEPAIARP